MKTKKWLFLALLGLFRLLPAQAEDKYFLTVSQDGKGDFTTIGKALEVCKAFPDQRVVIFVRNGRYQEKLTIPSCNTRLSLIGESAEKTILTWDDHFNRINRGRNSTFFTWTLKVEANDFILENFTVENSAGAVGQAVALHVEGDRCIFRNCRFLGNQDTVYLAGFHSRDSFEQCYIEGTTDFIFGEATALFRQCVIHCKADSYLTAASTPEGKAFGFVFRDCRIEASEGVSKVYLGRTWRSFARVAFLRCDMGAFVRPEGWDNWSKKENEKTAYYAEYANVGPGAALTGRVAWAHRLTKKQAARFTDENILGKSGWEKQESTPWYLAKSRM